MNQLIQKGGGFRPQRNFMVFTNLTVPNFLIREEKKDA
jgi:hypothetical protein